MNLKLSLIIVGLLVLSGCATTQVVDYDGENISEDEKQRMMDEGGIQYTEGIVELSEEDDVVIMAEKSSPTVTIHHDYEVVQDKWDITAHNLSDDNVCVTLHWKLMDFKFISDYASEFYVKENSILHVGTMIQQVWEIQGVRFTPDGSGYIAGMLVREPVEDADTGDECLFIEKEEDIVTK